MNGSRRLTDKRRRIESGLRGEANGIGPLAVLAVVSAVIYVVITFLSSQFAFASPTTTRPIILVLLFFGLLFAAYLLAIRYAARAKQNSGLTWMIVLAAIAFRVIVFFSVPIQEVDIYRYLWDGAVSSEGISPFRYPPRQILWADATGTEDSELRKLARLRDQTPALAEVLRRVHFADLPTIYPPTSQAVFYCAAQTTPGDASVATRVRVMKAWLIGFDLGILLLVIQLLRISRLPAGLSLVYAWCPLLLKEIANSGHLDVIAVFPTTLAVYMVVRLQFGSEKTLPNAKNTAGMVLTALILAAAIGAKLYPVVLAPLILFTLLRRFGWCALVFPTAVFFLATFLLLRPILPTPSKSVVTISANQSDPSGILRPAGTDAIESFQSTGQTPDQLGPRNDPSLGVTTFLKSWEMNDFIFMILVENLKPVVDGTENTPVWFSIVSDDVRQQVVNSVARRFSIPVAEAPFMATRLVTSFAFVMIACWLARRASKRQDIASFCEAGFLTLAWFWLLLPTQNPWYWLWALPLLPFVRNRAWLALSGIVLVYYLRFWLDYHFANTAVMGTAYHGTAFFDFVVTWLEYAPWFVWLGIEYWQRRKISSV